MTTSVSVRGLQVSVSQCPLNGSFLDVEVAGGGRVIRGPCFHHYRPEEDEGQVIHSFILRVVNRNGPIPMLGSDNDLVTYAYNPNNWEAILSYVGSLRLA